MVFPRATVLGIAFDTISREQRDVTAEAARKLGLEPRMIEVKGRQDYGGAFSAMDDARGQPIILPASPIFFRDREAIAQALLERRIPSIAAFRENMEAGALISYGFRMPLMRSGDAVLQAASSSFATAPTLSTATRRSSRASCSSPSSA